MKKFLCLLLAAAFVLGAFTACSKSGSADSATSSSGVAVDDGSADYNWTNTYGLKFDVSKLDYANFTLDTIYDETGNLKDIKGLDYVTLPSDYNGYTVKAADIAVTADELDGYVADLMKSYATKERITDRAVAEGDSVNIDFVGKVDGVEFTGGSTSGKGTDVTAGGEGYVDDFLDQIIDHKPGDTFDVVVTFPDNYQDSTDAAGNTIKMGGKEATFSTTINYINGESITPECTDEWVAANLQNDYGVTTVQEVRDRLESYYSQQNKYNAMTDYLTKNSTYADKLPDSVLEYNATALLYTQNYYAQYSSTTLEEALKASGCDSIAAFLDSKADTIIQNTKETLMMQALIEDMGISLSADEVKAVMGDYYDSYISTYGESYTTMYAAYNSIWSTLVGNLVVSD